jgi:uncharacterized protein YbaR (Trm112 family)
MIDELLLSVLACPACDSRPPLLQKSTFLVCKECGRGYRVENGIPNMLVEESLSPDDLDKELKSDG